jgi:oxygen-independent coproporphyrinogen-3 oxidase
MQGVLAAGECVGDVDAMSDEAAARERLVVGLRRRDGVERAAFRAASGCDIDVLAGAAIAGWVAQGLATDDGEVVRLTREGLLVSDALWAAILAPA